MVNVYSLVFFIKEVFDKYPEYSEDLVYELSNFITRFVSCWCRVFGFNHRYSVFMTRSFIENYGVDKWVVDKYSDIVAVDVEQVDNNIIYVIFRKRRIDIEVKQVS